MQFYRYEPKALVRSYKSYKDSELKEHEESNAKEAVSSMNKPQVRLLPSSSGSSFVVAAVQLTGAGLPNSDVRGYCQRAQAAVVDAATNHHAQLVLLPELWSGPYFCQSQEAVLMQLAEPQDSNFLLLTMQKLAKQYRVVLPISFYERFNNVLYNSIVMIEANGEIVGRYRKSHIPDGTGYQEKFYFTPGDTGFRVFETSVGKIGCAICWDQWNPECARAMALQGADILLYPTAIGSEPQDPSLDSRSHWQRCMQGHAAANMIPVVASNRYGTEILQDEGGSEVQRIHFYGKSFITDNTGAIVKECEENSKCDEPFVIISANINVEHYLEERLAWGVFRDRRPELYQVLLTKDGSNKAA